MTTTGMIYDYIDSIAPFATQMSFDNSGLLLGSREREIRSALVCLDPTSRMARQASVHGCQLIVSHHPVIFHPLSQVSSRSAVYALISSGVDVISAHTNYDVAVDGVNDCLAEALGFTGVSRPDWLELGVLVRLKEEMSPSELGRLVCRRLGCSARVASGGRPVRTVALIGGAGGSEVQSIIGRADALITGDAGHHNMIDAVEGGCTLIAAGHYETESIAVEPLRRRLAEQFGEVRFILGDERPVAELYDAER